MCRSRQRHPRSSGWSGMMGRKAKARRTRVGVGKGFRPPCTVKRGYLVPSIIPGEEPSPRLRYRIKHPHVPALCNSRGLQPTKGSRDYERQSLRAALRVRKDLVKQSDAFLRLDVHVANVDQRQSVQAGAHHLTMCTPSLFGEPGNIFALEKTLHRHVKQIVFRFDLDGEVRAHAELMRRCRLMTCYGTRLV